MKTPKNSLFFLRFQRAVAKLKIAVKFLLFMEDDPKHHVAKNVHAPMVSLIPAFILIMARLIFGTIQYGIPIFLLCYAVFSVAFLEVFHIMFDR